VLAKFGLLGTSVFVLLIIMAVRVCGSQDTSVVTPRWPAARAWSITALILLLPFGGPSEDKGLAFAFLLALGLARRQRIDGMQHSEAFRPSEHDQDQQDAAALAKEGSRSW
jgi:hypothetical protein